MCKGRCVGMVMGERGGGEVWRKVRCCGDVGLVKCGRGGTVVGAGDGKGRAVYSGEGI